ncbi:unnamed protein product [Linum trigynum]|uniref:Uncharacterized protein n=1 Tax=Linum trigynum TaxID=586398 RepID=A0AAV2E7L1_9ROSI
MAGRFMSCGWILRGRLELACGREEGAGDFYWSDKKEGNGEGLRKFGGGGGEGWAVIGMELLREERVAGLGLGKKSLHSHFFLFLNSSRCGRKGKIHQCHREVPNKASGRIWVEDLDYKGWERAEGMAMRRWGRQQGMGEERRCGDWERVEGTTMQRWGRNDDAEIGRQ